MARVPLGDIPGYEMRGEQPEPVNLLRALAHPPELAKAFSALLGQIFHGANTPRDRKLVTLAVGAERGNGYIWGHHSVTAEQSGVETETVEAIRSHDLTSLSAYDRALIEYAAAVDSGTVAEDLWNRLIDHLSLYEAVNATALAAYYGAIGRVQEALAVEQDPGFRGEM